MIKVFLPYKTRKLFDLPVEIDAEGNNLRNLIEFLDKKYPGYGFTNNAGYGVKLHLDALKTLGVTPIHRQTFKPIHNILYEEN